MCSLEFELLSEVSGSATAAKMKVMEVMVDVGGGEALRRRRGIDMTFRIIKHNFVGISRKYCGVGRILLEAIKTSGHSHKDIFSSKNQTNNSN